MTSVRTQVCCSRAVGDSFDNLKRILRVVEDLDGALVDNIQDQFCLHKDMSRQYAAIVFIGSNRFDTMKRITSKLPLKDFIVCANLLIDHWTVGSEGVCVCVRACVRVCTYVCVGGGCMCV